MRVRLLPAADRELEDAAAWYASNASRAVAMNFIAAYDTIANLISDNPGIRIPSATGTRTLRFRGFPYSAIYRLHSDHAVIVAVAHQHRRPGYWARRH